MLNPAPDTPLEHIREAPALATTHDLAEQRVTLRSLRYQLRTGRADLLGVAQALGITPVWLNDHTAPDSHHRTVTVAEGNRIVQAALALEAAEFADAERAEAAAAAAAAEDELVRARVERPGYIYLAQLEPKESPLRIKVGFTDDPPGRLNGHRCSAPYTRYLAIWPARANWESTARDAICAGCELIHSEVYVADSLEAARVRGEALFATLPLPPTVPRLVVVGARSPARVQSSTPPLVATSRSGDIPLPERPPPPSAPAQFPAVAGVETSHKSVHFLEKDTGRASPRPVFSRAHLPRETPTEPPPRPPP